MKKIISSVFLCIFILNMTGCATILKEKKSPVKIDSEPQGAEIYINKRSGEIEKIGQTPTTVTLDNRKNIQLLFKKDGYLDKKYNLKTGVSNGWMIASFVCAIGPAIVDALTRNARNFKYDDIKVSLKVSPNQALPIDVGSSRVDELLKYKQLLDNGGITKEEYEQKKKQLLGVAVVEKPKEEVADTKILAEKKVDSKKEKSEIKVEKVKKEPKQNFGPYKNN